MRQQTKTSASADACTADQPNRDAVHGLVLSNTEGYALAELCKRITFTTCREMATGDEEAYAMISATDRLRAALAQNGWAVR